MELSAHVRSAAGRYPARRKYYALWRAVRLVQPGPARPPLVSERWSRKGALMEFSYPTSPSDTVACPGGPPYGCRGAGLVAAAGTGSLSAEFDGTAAGEGVDTAVGTTSGGAGGAGGA